MYNTKGAISSKREQRYLAMAMRVAEKSECRQRHGAVAVRRGSVLGFATNVDRNTPSNLSPEHVRMHAALCAERRLLRNIDAKDAVVYVARVNSAGEPRLSAPCDRCEKELLMAGVKKVVWTE